jgi:choline dehydrogenase-like flavoprotein
MRDGVADGDLLHHDVENLFVAGGPSFPTYSPGYPTLTIAAPAIRPGDRLAAA